VLSEGTLSFSVQPMGCASVYIDGIEKYTADNAFINFYFTSKNDTMWCERGYPVCFEQILLTRTKAVAAGCSGKPVLSRDPMSFEIALGDIVYTVDRRKGCISSARKGNTELLAKPMEFNFFRAPTDNDGMKWDWYRAHLHEPVTKVYSTSAEEHDESIIITISHSFGWSIYQPFAKGETKLIFSGNGVRIVSDMHTSNKVIFLPRFGIRLFLPKSFDTAGYCGYGPYESYIDKHHASHFGSFTAPISEMHEDYIRPQENSSHYGCISAQVTSNAAAIRFSGDGFSFNASEYTQEELSSKRHNYELERCEHNVICVDSGMAGVGSASCGPALDEKFCISLPELHFDITMDIV
ncbi:MAG: glycoside hydrolase family 2, partial [Oscillospiraceae bacterium]|nr:glycoside hydrolase family 2 [Oscillospiraceae bacterium]